MAAVNTVLMTLLRHAVAQQEKSAVVPAGGGAGGADMSAPPGMPPGGGMPMDPSMMAGGMPPGGGMPMDPSMMAGGGMPPGGGMPMDPSMMAGGGMPPGSGMTDPATGAPKKMKAEDWIPIINQQLFKIQQQLTLIQTAVKAETPPGVLVQPPGPLPPVEAAMPGGPMDPTMMPDPTGGAAGGAPKQASTDPLRDIFDDLMKAGMQNPAALVGDRLGSVSDQLAALRIMQGMMQ